MTRTWIVENEWTCRSCDAQNLGRDMNCTACGAKKAPDVAEQMGSPDAAVTDPEMLRQAQAGANWICRYCGGQERDLRGESATCGGPRGLASARPKDVEYVHLETAGDVRVQNVRAVGDVLVRNHGERASDDLPPVAVVRDGEYDIRPRWSSLGGIRGWLAESPIRTIAVLGAILVAAGLVWLFVWLLSPRYVDARVSSVHWQYTASLRTREARHDAGWGRPGGKGFYGEAAFNVSCEGRYFGSEDCHPHDCRPHQVSYSCNCTSYDCNCKTSCTDKKNGYSSCTESCGKCSKCSTCYRTEYDTCYDSCSVYRDWCSYDYYEWPVVETRTTSGDDHKVHWPDLAADGPLQKLQKVEQYRVGLTCPDDAFEYVPKGISDFDRFDVGDLWRLRVGKVRDHHIEGMRRIRAQKAERE